MRICFDIGGTSIKYGIAYEEKGAIFFQKKEETPTDAKKFGGNGIEQKIMHLTKKMLKEVEADGICISTAGMVDSHTGEILYANENIPDYTGRNLKTLIEKKFGMPCTVENDVNCAALGETVYGAAKGSKSVVCLTVGTGIGGAVVLNGEVWHGHGGSAGEIGYMPLSGSTLEDKASTTAMVRYIEQQTGKKLDGRQIFSQAKTGDLVCRQGIERMCEYLAQGIAAGICLLDPEAVVLGGGVMSQKEYIWPLLLNGLQKYVKPVVLNRCKITFAELENCAGMAGAYAMFDKQMKEGLLTENFWDEK